MILENIKAFSSFKKIPSAFLRVVEDLILRENPNMTQNVFTFIFNVIR